jgi:hypothetical protein
MDCFWILTVSGGFTESIVEDATLAWLKARGYAVLYGSDIAAGKLDIERRDPNYCDVAPKTFISGELRVKDHSGLAEAVA